MAKHIPSTTAESVLQEAHEVRARGGSRHMEWGGMYLHIPTAHRRALSVKYPALDSEDWDIRQRAWERFIASSESAPYRVSTPKYFNGADIRSK